MKIGALRARILLMASCMKARHAGTQLLQSMFGGAIAFMAIAAWPGIASDARRARPS
jgi:hypothetical protein